MTRQVCIATIQVLVDEVNPDSASDGLSELLSHNPWVLDWSYLKLGGQYMYPRDYVMSNDYEEGEAFS